MCTAVENLASKEIVRLRYRVGIATGLVIAVPDDTNAISPRRC
jgi:hypothetical protein